MTMATVRSTGVGSWPGRDVGEAIRIAFAECPDLPYLPELPARGAPADIIGRGAAVLSGLGVDLQPAGWRLTATSGPEQRLALAWLRSDLDQWEEQAAGYTGDLKISFAGPWTMAASLERPRGERVLADRGARRDVAQSMMEGVADLAAEVLHRFDPQTLVVQIDEPLLPDVQLGRVRTTSGLQRYREIEVPEVSGVYTALVERLTAVSERLTVAVHCCAAPVPVALLHDAGVAQVYLDVDQQDQAAWDQIAARLERGLVLGAGVWPTTGRTLTEVVEEVTRPLERVGLALTEASSPGLHAHQLILTPACGLAGVSPATAIEALRTLRRAAGQVLERLAR